LAEKAAIDLKPFAADAKKQISAAVANFSSNGSELCRDSMIQNRIFKLA
jgi:hypothetical protein